MNELQLSNNLTTIETEIKSYQNLAGHSIFEIGRRLKHVKENDLAHGEFGKWLESINMNKQQAHRFMKVSEEYEQSNLTTSLNLGLNVLYEIATLPEEERTKEHVTSSGETKTPDEMTVRELRELKKQLKEERERNDSLAKQNEIANRKIEDLENVEPEVIEKYYEPDDYELLKSSLTDKEVHIAQLRNEISELKIEQNEVNEKSKKYDELNQAINEMNGRLSEGQLRIKNQKMVYDLVQKSEQLLKEVAPLTYALDQLDVEDNEYAKKPILNIIKSLDEISNKLKRQLKEKQIIEVN
ncbi:MAG TPA: DUF3102 domain-containing protein [Savagea sp.]